MSEPQNDTPERNPSADELDLKRRQEEAAAAAEGTSDDSSSDEPYAPYAVEGNDVSNFVGVSPEYMTYASETDKPFRAEEGPYAEVEKAALDQPEPTVAVDQAVPEDATPTTEPASKEAENEASPATQNVTEGEVVTPPVPTSTRKTSSSSNS